MCHISQCARPVKKTPPARSKPAREAHRRYRDRPGRGQARFAPRGRGEGPGCGIPWATRRLEGRQGESDQTIARRTIQDCQEGCGETMVVKIALEC